MTAVDLEFRYCSDDGISGALSHALGRTLEPGHRQDRFSGQGCGGICPGTHALYRSPGQACDHTAFTETLPIRALGWREKTAYPHRKQQRARLGKATGSQGKSSYLPEKAHLP